MRSTLSTLLFFLNVFLLPGVKGRDPIQHRIARRAPSPILDTCAYIDAPLSDILTSISGTNLSTANEEETLIGQCVCTSMIRPFLTSSDFDNVDVDKGGLLRAFETYVVEKYDAQHCVYPPHSVARCSRHDPCGFECSNGFKHSSFSVRGRQADACTCPLPNMVCDGQCGTFPEGCPSTTTASEDAPASFRNAAVRPRPSPFRRPSPRPSAAFHSYAATPTGSFSNARTQEAQDAGCAPHETRCGAYAPRGRRTVECVDTQRSLESCGGCMLPPPSPFYALDAEYSKREEPTGVDCSALEGVSDVGCRAGRCVVQACQAGWVIAHSGEHCVRNPFGNAAHPSAGDGAFDSARFVPSRMPLLKPSPSTTTTTSSDPPIASSTDSPQEPNANAADSGSSSDPPSDSGDSDSSSDSPSSPSSARFSSARTGVDPDSDSDAGAGTDGADTDLGLGVSTGLLSFGRFSASVAGDDGLPEDVTGLRTDDPNSGLGLGLTGALNLSVDPPDVNDVLAGQPLYRFGNLIRPFTEGDGDGDGDGETMPDPGALNGLDFAPDDFDAPVITIGLDIEEALSDGADIDPGNGLPPPPPGGNGQIGRFFGSISDPSADPVDLDPSGTGVELTGASGDGTNVASSPAVSDSGARLDLGRFFGAAPAANVPDATPPGGDNDLTGLSFTAETDASSVNDDIAAVDPIGALSRNNAAPPLIQGPNASDGNGLGIGVLSSDSGSEPDLNSPNLDTGTATGAIGAANSGLSDTEAGAETGAEGLTATLNPPTSAPASSLIGTAAADAPNGSDVAAGAGTA